MDVNYRVFFSKRRVLPVLFYLSVWVLLTLNFKGNILSSAWDFYHTFQYDSESLVVGRLSLSESEGLSAHAGFLGRVKPVPAGSDPFWYQYDLYRYGGEFETYEGYYSQPAGQAFLYGLVCKITGLSGDTALEMLWWLVSMFSAFMFTAFSGWVLCRWGWTVAVFTVLSIGFSQWVTAFGYNLYWILGAFYLPFVAALRYLQKYGRSAKHPLKATFWLMFTAMLLKCLLNGFEFITATLVMAMTPWVFYAVMYGWDWRQFFRRVAAASGGALAAVAATMVWLAVQLSFVMGSVGEGFEYILWSFGKRAHGGGGEFDPVFQESIDSSQWDVLVTYWNGHAFNLAHWSENVLWQSISKVGFGFCVLVFLFLTWVVLKSKTIRERPAFRRQQVALTVMLWLSLMAPLSWFVIFKGHSYLHTHMDHIVWHMPFMLLGAVLMGSVLWFFIRTRLIGSVPNPQPDCASSTPESKPTRNSKSRTRNLRRTVFCCLSIFLIIILLRLFVFEPCRVSGDSMEATLLSGDWLAVNKLRYGGRLPQCIADIPIINVLTWIPGIRHNDEQRQWSYRRLPGYADLQYNDVVVFAPPGHRQQNVKRVVGLPGDTVEIRAGQVWVNGNRLEEIMTIMYGQQRNIPDDPSRETGWPNGDYGPVDVPDGSVPGSYPSCFLLGDNRDNSFDSRHHGVVTLDRIVGKASFVLFSSGRDRSGKRKFRLFHPVR
ncbi:MAG: signal peptidase I [Bacteroidales bacterium]|jgi:signal peptidase I|nr:signal peptidase I [Bacteroidales bacterium]